MRFILIVTSCLPLKRLDTTSPSVFLLFHLHINFDFWKRLALFRHIFRGEGELTSLSYCSINSKQLQCLTSFTYKFQVLEKTDYFSSCISERKWICHH